MYCSKCGAKIDDDSTFCICCGAAVTAGARRKAERKTENEETAELPKISKPDEAGLTQTENSGPARQAAVQTAQNQDVSGRTAPVHASSVQPAPKSTMTEKPAPQQSEPVQVTSEAQKAPPAAAPIQAAAGGGDAGPADDKNGSSPQRSEAPDRTAGNTSAGGSGTSSGSSGPPSRPPERPGDTAPRTGGSISCGTTRRRIRTNRGWFRFLILSLITCGIYGLYYIHALSRDVNILCEEDGKHTTGLFGLIGLTIVTCGFFNYYWGASIIDRVAANLALQYKIIINATGLKYILWRIPGTLLFGIGPLIALHTLLKSINQLAVAYNARYGL